NFWWWWWWKAGPTPRRPSAPRPSPSAALGPVPRGGPLPSRPWLLALRGLGTPSRMGGSGRGAPIGSASAPPRAPPPPGMASCGAGGAPAAAEGAAWASYGAGDRRCGPDEAERESRKQQVTRAVCLSMLCGVCQQVITLQSEPRLVQQLSGGDAAAAARLLGNTAGLIGALGLIVNQVGSKLSDSLGRKAFFVAGPATTFLAQALIAKFPGSRRVVLSCRVVKGLMTAFLSSVMATTSLTDVLSGQELAMALSKISAVVGLGVSATSIGGEVRTQGRQD
ncbi:unnamed protein product, partial [Prorocentrum cordatum]